MKSGDRKFKALFLGGAHSQVPIIKEAKSRGYYIVSCDYLPENPGHKFADEYHNVSTTDFDGILNLAINIKPDFIVAYASDPAASTAAYVSEKMGLPGNSYKSIRILSEKDLFRAFQRGNGFSTPQFLTFCETDNFIEELQTFKYPFIVKPTDSSGSKGVSKVSGPDGISPTVISAFGFSRNKKIIAEEFIDNTLADIHGDGFVVDGELVFSCLGDHIYNTMSNPFNPVGTLWPSSQPDETISKIVKEVADTIRGCGFRNGAINIEARVNSEGKSFVMEIGPRSGGHFVPQAIKYVTGFDMVKATLDIFSGGKIIIPDQLRKCCAYYAVHSDNDGILLNISINGKLKRFVKEFNQYIFPGGRVRSFTGANAAIGVLLLSFNSQDEMEFIMNDIHKLISLEIEYKN